MLCFEPRVANVDQFVKITLLISSYQCTNWYSLSTQLQNILIFGCIIILNESNERRNKLLSQSNILSNCKMTQWGNQMPIFFYLLAPPKKGLISLFGFCPGRKSFWSLINHHSNNFGPTTLFPLTWLQLLVKKKQKQNMKIFT